MKTAPHPIPAFPTLGKGVLFSPAFTKGRTNYLSEDGRCLVDVRDRLRSARDLSAAILDLASAVGPRQQGVFCAFRPLVSRNRLEGEWKKALGVLRPELAARLGLLVVADVAHLERDVPESLRRLLATLIKGRGAPGDTRRAGDLPPRSFFTVLKVLLVLHFRGSEPVTSLDLGRRTGLSYLSVARALARLASRGELSRGRDRRVALEAFPEESWRELLSLSSSLRPAASYLLPAGESFDPVKLHSRILRAAPQTLAIGGVEAARHFDPGFDLEGWPRLDFTLQVAGAGEADLGFMRKADPALRLAGPGETGRIAVVIHPLRRPESFFEAGTGAGGGRYADPVETLLDLHELRLGTQAEALRDSLSKRRVP